MNLPCDHLDQIRAVTPRTPNGCEECLELGDTWVHLRLCMTCGHVGCCDDSKNKHATKHFHATGHPIIKSFEPGEDWGWCYADGVVLDGGRWPIRDPAAARYLAGALNRGERVADPTRS